MEKNINEFEDIFELPVISLRNVVALPQTSIFIDIARKASVSALDLCVQKYKYVFLVAQKDALTEEPVFDDLYKNGVIAQVVNVLKTSGTEIRVSFKSISKAVLIELKNKVKNSMIGVVSPINEGECLISESPEIEAAVRVATDSFARYMTVADGLPKNLLTQAASITDAIHFAYFITQSAMLPFENKQKVLDCDKVIDKLEVSSQILDSEIEIIEIEKSIANKVKDRINKSQKDFYLREQIRAIQEELGEDEDDYENLSYDLTELLNSIHNSAMPEKNKELMIREFKRMMKLPFGTQEAALIRSYIESCVELPWEKHTVDKLDIIRARKILDADHYGLDKIKDCIIESLAVKQFNKNAKGQILCLVGPPGTGKTSIATSVAKALNRKFVRISLGGIYDESEIRGHRRTYVGAMPGKIMSAIKEAGTCNPLILLDEIDKLGHDYRGDPSAALLEVLDPEQNKTFRDHFIDMDFDLSDVFFITTANVADSIPYALYDRMNVIELSSYTAEEKYEIAKKHLLPKQLKRHGMTSKNIKVTASALNNIILYYTREAGVRNLERNIAQICRKVVKQLVINPDLGCVHINEKNISEYLGPRKFIPEHIPETDTVGVVTGLAYTTVGGEILPLEVNVMDGTGKTELTGSLGDVMKESAKAAISYIRSNAQTLGIDPMFYKNKDIHIHAPEGAIPKDGPSAGCAMATALYSQLSGKSIRREVAMTGEITIRGNVLAIGGLKEKTMAAYKCGVKTVIIPEENKPDLDNIAPIVRQNIEFITAKSISDVFKHAFRE